MSPDEQARLEGLIQVLLDEHRFYGAAGLEVTDEMRLVITGTAARLILHLDLSHYRRLGEIVVYPYDFVRPEELYDDDGELLGEAHDFGAVVLSWPAVLADLAGESDGRNTIAHEFAHILDLSSQDFDGTPALRERDDYGRWAFVMTDHFEALIDEEPGLLEVLDEYGTVDEAEFFAVATEAYLERPERMRQLLPELFSVLEKFYGLWGPRLRAS